MDIVQKKRELREAIKKRLAGFSAKELAAESRTLQRTLLKLLPEEPITIAAFLPLETEPNIWPVLLTLLKQGSSLFVPTFETGEMRFRQLVPEGRQVIQYIDIWDHFPPQDVPSDVVELLHLRRGPLGILEPQSSAPLLDPQKLSHVLVPGRAFDRKGNRLGRGNGGYDHFIAAQRKVNSETKFSGICFECQIVQEVPMEKHDEKVDAVITARGLLNV